MERRVNNRGSIAHFVSGQHLELKDLKIEARRIRLQNRYLYNENIPDYPRPEIHVSRLKHDAGRDALRGIRRDEGFRCPHKKDDEEGLVWWSLDVGPEEINSAETRLLESTFPDRTEEQAQMQQNFLEKFASSPAFLRSSRLGSYRFSFPLEEVLEAYKEQFCCGEEPIMRVYETVLYKQEVMFSVLVHSPANQERFKKYPLLTDDPDSVRTYKDGCFIWRPQAMCQTHCYRLILRRDENQMEAETLSQDDHQYYVWDNVAIALHVDQQVLKFDADRLRNNLKFCRKGSSKVKRFIIFDDFPHAEALVKKLWPEKLLPLEKAE